MWFLDYVDRKYMDIKFNMKGLHLNLDSWRPYRGKGGW